ncbi:MAG: DUF2203 family protein [Gemmataceae bacterium]|nr:DUF2203 domain-containing protein [Gemmata sp.]MDW8197018.1 DUF2203 family protein [Gemmataceae bacterium]
MSNTPNRASNSAGKPRKKEVILDLRTARQMLPLIKSILTDIVNTRRRLNRLTPEQQQLDRHRRELAWQERQRRYQVAEEIANAEKDLAAAVEELNGLGVNLVDDLIGEVDFPTKVNGRPAAFSWQLGEDNLRHWHYADEESRRPIPAEWDQNGVAPPPRLRGGQP